MADSIVGENDIRIFAAAGAHPHERAGIVAVFGNENIGHAAADDGIVHRRSRVAWEICRALKDANDVHRVLRRDGIIIEAAVTTLPSGGLHPYRLHGRGIVAADKHILRGVVFHEDVAEFRSIMDILVFCVEERCVGEKTRARGVAAHERFHRREYGGMRVTDAHIA